MSDVESFPSWVYTFFIAPLGYLFTKMFTNTKTITAHGVRLDNHDEKIKKMCESNDSLTKEVHELIGTLKEHLRDKRL